MRNFAFAALFAFLLITSGCSKFLGNLRRDLDDSPAQYQPTTGGLWPERGMLSDDPNFDRYQAVGHSDRSPASVGAPPVDGAGGDSWVNPEQAESNMRDAYRTYSQNPNVPPAIRRAYRGNQRATRADFVDSNPNEGSLWASNGQTNYYFTKNKIRGVGDIVSITVEDKLVNDIASEVRNTLTPKEREFEIAAAQERLAQATRGPADEKSQSPKPAAEGEKSAEGEKPKEEKEVREATFQDVDVKSNIDMKTGEVIMGEIVERYPNGNYKIRATKQINYRGGQRLLNLVGIAKSTDINETDVVASSKLYEYRLAVLR